jgi:hypothetical protein
MKTNLIQLIQDTINDEGIVLKPQAPSKILLLDYSEKQNRYGLVFRFIITALHTNATLKVTAKLENDYYGKSIIEAKLSHTKFDSTKVFTEEYDLGIIYTGENPDTYEEFFNLKKHFYNPFVQYDVFPQA